MARYLRHPVFIGIVCYALGALSFWGAQKLYFHQQQSALEKILSQIPGMDGVSKDDLLDPSQDAFSEHMQRMQQELLKELSSAGGLADEDMEVREDDKFVYYEFDLGDATPTNFNVKVEDGQVWISGKIEDKSSGSVVSSEFERSFPAPANTDARKVEFENTATKIVVKFPKLG